MGKKSKMLVMRCLVVVSVLFGLISCTTTNPPVNTTTGATKTK